MLQLKLKNKKGNLDMTFYTLNYIENSQSTDRLIFNILILVTAVLMILFALLYVRNRFATRYRDLGIIALLLLLIFAGTQYEKYMAFSQKKDEASQIIPFIQSVAQDKNVKTSDVLVNSTTLTDGLIVRIDSKNIDYQLKLNEDKNSYSLTRAHVIDHRVEVKN